MLGLEREVGTLRPGSLADVALFRLLHGRFPLYDIWGEMREARELLVNTLTIVGGRPLEPPAAAAAGAVGAATRSGRRAQLPFTERQQALRDRGHTPGVAARGRRGGTSSADWTHARALLTRPRAATGQRPARAALDDRHRGSRG